MGRWPLERLDRLSDVAVVDAPSEVVRLLPKRRCGLLLGQTCAYELVDGFANAYRASAAQALNSGGNIVREGDCCAQDAKSTAS